MQLYVKFNKSIHLLYTNTLFMLTLPAGVGVSLVKSQKHLP